MLTRHRLGRGVSPFPSLLFAVMVIAACSNTSKGQATGASDSAPSRPVNEIRAGGAGFIQPIEGDPVTLGEAQRLFPQPLPVVQGVTLPDACSGVPTPVNLQVVFAQGAPEPPAMRRVGMMYANGIVVLVSDQRGFSPDMEGGDLAPIDQALEPDAIGQDGFRQDTVRGHVAWVTDVITPLDCGSGSMVAEPTVVPGAFGSPVIGPTGYPDGSASITWVERGVMIIMGGPYSVEQLKSVADAISWRNPS